MPGVVWVDEATQMECHVSSSLDASVLRKVTFVGPGRPPKCCKWVGRYPCFHGAAVIIVKHGVQQLSNAASRYLHRNLCVKYTRRALVGISSSTGAASRRPGRSS